MGLKASLKPLALSIQKPKYSKPSFIKFNSMKYVASRHQKAFLADVKPVYRAVTKDAAEAALDELDAKWGKLYPIVIESWRRKWANLSVYF